MFCKKVLVSLTLIPLTVWSQNTLDSEHVEADKRITSNLYVYKRPAEVSEEVWEMVQPYLLPSNHPIKKKLDRIFKKSRVTANAKSIRKAGFPKYSRRQFSRCTVSPHPDLRGYIVKMYTDDMPEVSDHYQWIRRIEGAKCIQATIDRCGYRRMFKVPKKWIYPLPASPKSSTSNGKNFVLIAEDMNIYSSQRNKDKWKSDWMGKQRADAMYIIMAENGLSDCIYPFNIPFCKDRKQAFIDTEHHHRWPVHFSNLNSYFTIKMAEYWQKLVVEEGPK